MNSEVVERNILAGRGVVLAISHMGSWELYAQAAFQRPETRFGTIYQALRNPYLDELINRDRRKGVETFDRKKGFQAAIALVAQAGIHGSAGGPKRRPRRNLDAVLQPPVLDLSSCSHPGDPHEFRCRARRHLYFRLRPLAHRLLRRNPLRSKQPRATHLRISMQFSSARSANRPRIGSGSTTVGRHRGRISFIARQKRGIYLPPGTDPAKLHPFRFVIRSPNWLGDAVMSLRAARAFKLGRPDARLAVLTPAKLDAFWKSVAEVDEVISFAPEESVFSVARQTTRTLRGRDPLPQFVSQRGRGVACQDSAAGGISRAFPIDVAHSNNRRAQEKEGRAAQTPR